jgi:hypothetical protein
MAYIGPSIETGFRQRFVYTATAGQTSFSGNDSVGISLTYTDSEYLDVYQNGVLLVPGSDYAATTGTTVVLVTGASLNDKVEMIAYQSFGVADTVSRADGGAFGGAISMASTLAVTGNTTITGTSTFNNTVSEPNKEYFHVDLTTAMTGLGDTTIHFVDFGGKGTVKYDTKSNFDSANDAYLLDSSDGVYLINFSIGIRSDDLAAETILDAMGAIFIATDGSTFVAVNGAGARGNDRNSDEIGSVMFSGSFIYKSTTATTKIAMKSYANTYSSATYEISDDAQENQGGSAGTFSTARCTFLSIARIA